MPTELEQQTAKLLNRMEGFFDDQGDFSKMSDRLKSLEESSEELKGSVDQTAVLTELDRIKAVTEGLEKTIRASKSGFYVPGIEEVKDFSMLRAIRYAKFHEVKGNELEKEVMDAVRSKRAQVVGDEEYGGAFVPDQVIPEIIGAIYTRSVLIDLAGDGQTRLSTIDGLTGGKVTIPKFDGGVIAYWIGEEDSFAESAAKVGNITMSPHKLGLLVRITDEMRRFGAYGFENLLRQDMIRAAAKKIDWTAFFGTGGAHMPRGIVYHPNMRVISAAAPATLMTREQAEAHSFAGAPMTFDALDEMELHLEEDDVDLDGSAATISSRRFFKKLAQIKVTQFDAQTSGESYLLGAPMLTRERLASVIGTFDASNQLPNAGTPGQGIFGEANTDALHSPVFRGNWAEGIFGRWAGIEIVDDGGTGTGFISDHTHVKLRMYADFGWRQDRAMVWCPDADVRS